MFLTGSYSMQRGRTMEVQATVEETGGLVAGATGLPAEISARAVTMTTLVVVVAAATQVVVVATQVVAVVVATQAVAVVATQAEAVAVVETPTEQVVHPRGTTLRTRWAQPTSTPLAGTKLELSASSSLLSAHTVYTTMPKIT